MTVLLSGFTAPQVPKSGAWAMPEEYSSFGDALWTLFGNAMETLHPNLTECANICFSILVVVLLISVLKLFPGARENLADFVGAVGISVILLDSSNSLVNLSVETVTEISHYGKLLLPVMASAMAAQGCITTSTALYAGTAMFNAVLGSLITELIVPAVYMFLTLSVAYAALGEEILKNLAGVIKGISTWILKTILYVFTVYIGITGVVSGSTDAMTLKAAKMTISWAVPMVGGILADASEAVLVGAGVVKNAAGIYGILAILSLFAGPFLKIGCQYLLIKLTGTICSIFGTKRSTDLIGVFSVTV